MRALIENPYKRMGFSDDYIEVIVTGRTASSASETLVEVTGADDDEDDAWWMSQHDVFLIREVSK